MQYMNRIDIQKLLDCVYDINVVIGMKKMAKNSLHIFGQEGNARYHQLPASSLKISAKPI